MSKSEDILMPNDETIKKMNEEYAAVLSRKSLLEECKENEDINSKNQSICTANSNILRKAYCMESDIILLLDFLMNKARLTRTRKIIYDIMKIKNTVKNKLTSLYSSISSEQLNYESTISDKLSYNSLHEEIFYAEASLISLLKDIIDDSSIESVVLLEYSASIMLMAIRP